MNLKPLNGPQDRNPYTRLETQTTLKTASFGGTQNQADQNWFGGELGQGALKPWAMFVSHLLGACVTGNSKALDPGGRAVLRSTHQKHSVVFLFLKHTVSGLR